MENKKIAVYTIALNEEKFAKRWAESCHDADQRVVLDTGSSDETVNALFEQGVQVAGQRFDPWRFDVARNASLALVDQDIDICIALDMDEVLLPGWRDMVIGAWQANTTRLRYEYVWSWKSPGEPDLTYYGDKIHARQDYIWRHPVHEVLWSENEVQSWLNERLIEHYPDSTKSRSSYRPLLELSVQEDPSDDRNAHYYGRELFFSGQYEAAITELRRHLLLPKALWKTERAASMNYIAQAYTALSQPAEALRWLLAAIAESPEHREPWVQLAVHFYHASDWAGCLWASKHATGLTERPKEYMTNGEAWGALPWDMLALAHYNLGLFTEALDAGRQAVTLAPEDARLHSNVEFYQARV